MYCPQCGINQSDELKFCKQCGANLLAVRQVVNTKDDVSKFDWSKSWVTEMFLSDAEKKRRAEELDRRAGITPEVKRLREIKAGVMTSSVGLGVMIFLYVMSQGLIAAGMLPHIAVEIIRCVWVAGVIPFFIGGGLILNGAVISKKFIESAEHQRQLQAMQAPVAIKSSGKTKEDLVLSTPGQSEPDSPRFSITENTTRRLSESDPVK